MLAGSGKRCANVADWPVHAVGIRVRGLEAGNLRLSESSLAFRAVSAIDGFDYFRGEACGKHHFEHFNILAVTKFAVTNAGRLVDA